MSISLPETIAQSRPYQILERSLSNGRLAHGIPDLTILLDLPPDIGMQRVRERSNGELDRMEQEDISFFNEVRRGYLELAYENPDRFLVLDAGRPIDVIETEIWNAVEPRLG